MFRTCWHSGVIVNTKHRPIPSSKTAVMVLYVYSGASMPAQSIVSSPLTEDGRHLGSILNEGGGGEGERSNNNSNKKKTRVVHIHLVHGQRFNKLPPLRGSAIIQSALNTSSDAFDQLTSSRDTYQQKSRSNDVDDNDENDRYEDNNVTLCPVL